MSEMSQAQAPTEGAGAEDPAGDGTDLPEVLGFDDADLGNATNDDSGSASDPMPDTAGTDS